ncbi:hypothetical protein DVH24_004961 [Malus domestica]|uniref:Uncharacterized protein n=1 Tax=Malus domestica TaxID=3750 RepID=A0A498IGD4_MALDO|nr:hypothetical protein DVH24_004961 [Malus domestica]
MPDTFAPNINDMGGLKVQLRELKVAFAREGCFKYEGLEKVEELTEERNIKMWKKERNTNMWKMKMKRIKKKKMEMKKNMKREKKTKRVDEGKMGKVEGSSGKEVIRVSIMRLLFTPEGGHVGMKRKGRYMRGKSKTIGTKRGEEEDESPSPYDVDL